MAHCRIWALNALFEWLQKLKMEEEGSTLNALFEWLQKLKMEEEGSIFGSSSSKVVSSVKHVFVNWKEGATC